MKSAPFRAGFLGSGLMCGKTGRDIMRVAQSRTHCRVRRVVEQIPG